MKKVIIIDYGAGNIRSLINAFEYQNINVEATNDKTKIKNATHLVLPGVGAFPIAMKLLHDQNIIDLLKSHCFKKKPFLGICLGMQMMFDFSCEFKNTKGLGLIEGNVQKLPENETLKSKFKIPNIGWYKLINNTNNNKISFFENNYSFYFVHSFHCLPKDQNKVLFYSNFNNYKFCSAICYENLLGFQFHPEKSRDPGLKLLKQFSNM